MVQIREILPGIFQCQTLHGLEIRASIYVKRPFGNYLFYESSPHPDLIRLMRAQGGLVKYFHEPGQSHESASRLFTQFGASSVFVEKPRGEQDYRWELFEDNRLLYRGVKLIQFDTLPHKVMYFLQHQGKHILLPNSLLALSNGHWSFKQVLNQRQKTEVTAVLGELDFDYLIPKYSMGYISFQPVEQDFKVIQLRHLAQARV